jgi:hypothetical protein
MRAHCAPDCFRATLFRSGLNKALGRLKEKQLVPYPIHVKRSTYRGSDPKKRQKASEENRVAALLETHINERIKAQTRPVESYLYYQIASETGVSEKTVRALCYGIDGGHNGFTVIRSGLSYEQALEAVKSGA